VAHGSPRPTTSHSRDRGGRAEAGRPQVHGMRPRARRVTAPCPAQPRLPAPAPQTSLRGSPRIEPDQRATTGTSASSWPRHRRRCAAISRPGTSRSRLSFRRVARQVADEPIGVAQLGTTFTRAHTQAAPPTPPPGHSWPRGHSWSCRARCGRPLGLAKSPVSTHSHTRGSVKLPVPLVSSLSHGFFVDSCRAHGAADWRHGRSLAARRQDPQRAEMGM